MIVTEETSIFAKNSFTGPANNLKVVEAVGGSSVVLCCVAAAA